MLNVLFEEFPDYVFVNKQRYSIETDFREWIRFAELADDDTVPWTIKANLMLGWYKECPDNIEDAIYALGDFLAAKSLYDENGTSKKRSNNSKPAFSFQEDAGCIYSAFIDCYGLDLQRISYMHWWKFKTLFDWLPEDTEIKQRIFYRTLDANSIKDKEERKRVKRIQREIALQKKRPLNDYDIGDVFA